MAQLLKLFYQETQENKNITAFQITLYFRFDLIPLTTNEKASSPANPILAFALSGKSATKPLSDWHAILLDGEQRIIEKKAWNYIIDNIATNAVNNAYGSSGDPFAP